MRIPHNRFAFPAFLIAAGLVFGGVAGIAQPMPATDQDHAAHHPGADATPPQDAAPPSGMPMTMMGKSGQAGMMPGTMQDMMSMMAGRMSMMSSQVEDRISFLRSSLQITDMQMPQWNHFAEALRAAAKSMQDMSGEMMSGNGMTSLPARLDAMETMLSAHLTALRLLKEAMIPLYASFSDEQKKRADELMVGPMGMM